MKIIDDVVGSQL